MALELKKGSTPTVEFYPADAQGSLSAVEAAVYSPAGVLLATITGAIDSAADAVTSSTTLNEIVVDDSSQFVAGRQYLLMADASPEPITVQTIDVDSDTLTLSQRPADRARAGNDIFGLRCTAVLTADCTAEVGVNYRIEWTVTPDSGDDLVGQTMYHVVYMPLGRVVTVPLTVQVLKQYSEETPDRFGAAVVRQMADGGERRLRALIESVHRYPHKYGDPTQFTSAGIQALKLELCCTYGMIPPGFIDGQGRWEFECRRSLDNEFKTAARQLGWYDDEETREPEGAPEPSMFSATIEL